MIHDGYYKLSERDGKRLLQLVGHLKEAIAELLSNRYSNNSSDDGFKIPFAELYLYEQSSKLSKEEVD